MTATTDIIDEPEDGGARRRILHAALSVFAEMGFAGASTREIARRAGVHQPAIAYHFGNKEELWKAAASAVFADMDAELSSTLACTHAPKDRLRGLIHGIINFVAANPEWFSFVIHEARQTTGRNAWLVDTCFQPMMARIYEALTNQRWPDTPGPAMARAVSMVALLGGSTSLFVQRNQIIQMAGVDTMSPDFIAQHADAVFTALSALIDADP